MAKKKWLTAVAGVLGLAGAGWLGSAVLMGQQLESRLQGWQNAPQGPGGGVRITRLTHEHGLLASSGQAELAFEPGCAAAPGADGAVTVRVDYSVSHRAQPGRLVGFDWQATPLGASAEVMKAVFGGTSTLAGQGELAMNGAWRTDMALPPLALRRSGEAVTVAPSKGFLAVNGPAIQFGWQVDRLDVRGDGQALAARDIRIAVDLKNRHRGTGTASLTAAQLSLDAGTLDGVSLTTEVREQGDRLDMRIVPAVRRVQAAGMDLNALSMAMAVNGLDTYSVETLSQLFEASCGFRSMTANEGRQARDAALRLMARGLSLGISQVSGQSADGGLDGQLMVELAPGSGDRPSLATQLKASGHLQLNGSLLPANARQSLLAMGLATAQGNGLRAAFDYGNGQLRLNERSQDAAPMLAGLKAADAQMHSLLAQWGQATNTVLAARAPAATPAEPSAAAVADPAAPSDSQPPNQGASADAASAGQPAPAPVVATATTTATAAAVATTAAPAVLGDSAQQSQNQTRRVAVLPVAGEPPALVGATAAPTQPGATNTANATAAATTSAATASGPSAAANCSSAATCLAQTLAAARRADISTVRQVATAFDALGKPAPGNRPVSRQLNSTGLAALKRDDLPTAVSALRQAWRENPRDVEIGGNLGFALARAGQWSAAVEVLQAALVLDPRRSGTWAPLAEALALGGKSDEARAAIWVSFQWSAQRDKSLAFYQDRMANEPRAQVQALYSHIAALAQQQMTVAQ